MFVGYLAYFATDPSSERLDLLSSADCARKAGDRRILSPCFRPSAA